MTINIKEKTIGFVGCGRLGSVLMTLLHQKELNINVVSDFNARTSVSLARRINCKSAAASTVATECDVVFLTVPDAAIEEVVASLIWREGQYVIHCSGVSGLEILKSAAGSGALTGNFHPLQSFADIETGTKNMPGSWIGIDAEGELFNYLEDLASLLECKSFDLSGINRPLYHSAAVVASNFLPLLVSAGNELLVSAGLKRDVSTSVLLPLMKGMMANLQDLPVEKALTGPIARNDMPTIRSHIMEMKQLDPEILSLYVTLARRLAVLAGNEIELKSILDDMNILE